MKTLIRVRYKPVEGNYEVVAAEGQLEFRTSQENLEQFIKDLRGKEDCSLMGIPEGELLIEGGGNAPQRKQIAEYIELVLEYRTL